MVWPVQTHPAQSTGPESKRNSGDGEYFSLDFSFYRTALPETGVAPVDGLPPLRGWDSPGLDRMPGRLGPAPLHQTK